MKNEYILGLERVLLDHLDDSTFMVEAGSQKIKVLLDKDVGFSTGLSVKINKYGKYVYVAKRYQDGSKRKESSLGRFILGLDKDDVRVCDHINRNPLDNRRVNLRVATRSQNSLNRLDESASGYRYVSFIDKEDVTKGYRLDIMFKGGLSCTTSNRFKMTFNYSGHNIVNLAMLADCLMVRYDREFSNTNFNKEIYTDVFISTYLDLYHVDLGKVDMAMNAYKSLLSDKIRYNNQ